MGLPVVQTGVTAAGAPAVQPSHPVCEPGGFKNPNSWVSVPVPERCNSECSHTPCTLGHGLPLHSFHFSLELIDCKGIHQVPVRFPFMSL